MIEIDLFHQLKSLGLNAFAQSKDESTGEIPILIPLLEFYIHLSNGIVCFGIFHFSK